ncbi:MAG TPA: hypothetical protein VF035_02010 [Longimicrobiales bacterium]
MGRFWGGIGLIALALFMGLGYAAAEVSGGAAALAFMITVLLPGGAGIAMVAAHYRRRNTLTGTKDELRRQTVESELLRLAARRGGRLTVVEAVTDLAVSPEDAKQGLDALVVRGMADFAVTESGVVVYTFHDIERVGDKFEARGLLE